MNNSEVTCEGEPSSKRSRYSIKPFNSLPDRFFVYGNEEYSHVITIMNEDTIVYGNHDSNKKDEYFIMASKSKRRFLYVEYRRSNGKVVPVDFDQEKVEILDIGGLGERWEGPSLEEMPFGWGQRFDDSGELVYEGFSVFGKYSLYGTEYDPNTHTVLYRGTWCDGLRCGIGESYDRNGSLLCKGKWVNDSYVKDDSCFVFDSPDLSFIGSHIVTLFVGENCCGSNSSLVLQSFPRLREVVIGNGSFGKKSEEEMVFVCVNCPMLVRIELGKQAMQFFRKTIITGESCY